MTGTNSLPMNSFVCIQFHLSYALIAFLLSYFCVIFVFQSVFSIDFVYEPSYICLNVNKTDLHSQWHAKKMTGEGHAQFREKLLEILSMPYNQREYKELWHEITYRKPIKRHRELRGRMIIYDAGPGKSYLDYYSGQLDMYTTDCCFYF